MDTDRWMEIIRRYTEISELDETILFELVDRIEVGDTQKVNGQRICEVKVYYRYVGNVDGALAQKRGQDYGEAMNTLPGGYQTFRHRYQLQSGEK